MFFLSLCDNATLECPMFPKKEGGTKWWVPLRKPSLFLPGGFCQIETKAHSIFLFFLNLTHSIERFRDRHRTDGLKRCAGPPGPGRWMTQSFFIVSLFGTSALLYIYFFLFGSVTFEIVSLAFFAPSRPLPLSFLYDAFRSFGTGIFSVCVCGS